MYAIANADPQPLSRYNNKATPELERIVFTALAKDPQSRYASVADLLVDLKALQTGPSVVTGATPAPGYRPADPATRMRWRLPLVAVIVLATIAAAYLTRSVFIPSATQGAVAVLPFVNTSEDPDTEYLSAGVTESLISRLSAISDLRVMSHHTVSRFKGGGWDPRAVGRELGVSAILVGHLDSRGGKLVVGVELLDVEDGRQIWGDRFDRDHTDLLAIERDIVTHISDKLRVQLTGEETQRLAQLNDVDPEAYSLYLRGRYFQQGTSDDGPERAQEFFRQALAIEPRFALAYAGLGDSYVNQAWLSSADREEMLPKARAALAKAMEIDDELSEAHMLSGLIKMYFDWDWDAAERAYQRAIQLKPGSDMAHRRYASYLNIVGRHDEAVEVARRAKVLDPLSVYAVHQLAYNLMCAGRYEEAASEFNNAIELNPTWVWGHIKLGMSYAKMGDLAKAEAAKARADALLEGEPGSPLSQHWRAHIELLAGKPQRIHDTLAHLLDRSQTHYVDPFILALCYHDVGQHERALDMIEEAFEIRSPLCVYHRLSQTVSFYNIRKDPRYQSVIAHMKYPPASLP